MVARPLSRSNDDTVNLAEDRTEYAADRTALANERTSSAWIRTGLAAAATGFGFARFLGDTLPGWIVLTVTATLVLCGIAAFALSAWRYRGVGRRLKRSAVPSIPFPLVLAVNSLLILAMLLGLFGLWFG